MKKARISGKSVSKKNQEIAWWSDSRTFMKKVESSLKFAILQGYKILFCGQFTEPAWMSYSKTIKKYTIIAMLET